MARVFNLSVLFKVVDKASGPLLQVGQKIDGLKQPLGRVQYSLKALARDPSWANIKIAAGRVGTAMSAMAAKAAIKLKALSASLASWSSGMMRRMLLPMLAGGGLLAVISRTAGAYDESMRMIRSITGATADEMGLLGGAIREATEGTPFSLREGAGAALALVREGVELNDVFRTLRPALVLAAAANIDLAEAASVVDTLFDQLAMNGDEVAGAIDKITVASERGGIDMNTLNETLRKGGAFARRAGFSFEEMLATFIAMEKAGQGGGRGGMALFTAMSELAKPTKEQLKVWREMGIQIPKNKRGFELLVDVAEQVNKKGINIEQLEAISPMVAKVVSSVAEHTEEVKKLIDGFDTSMGAALDRLKTKMEGLMGKLSKLRKSWEDLSTEVFGTDVTLTSVIDKLSELMVKLTDYTKKNPELMQSIIKLAGLATLLLPVLWVVGTIGRGLNTLGGALRWVLAFFGVGIGKSTKFALAMRGIWKWIGLLIWRFRALGSAIGILLLPFALNWESTKELLRTIWEEIVGIFTSGVAKCLRVLDTLTLGRLGLDDLADEMENLGARLAPIRIPKVETRVGPVPAEQMAGRMLEQKTQTDINLKINTAPGVTATVESKRNRGQGYANVTISTGPAYLGAVP